MAAEYTYVTLKNSVKHNRMDKSRANAMATEEAYFTNSDNFLFF